MNAHNGTVTLPSKRGSRMAPNDLIALKAHFANWQKTRGLGLTDVIPFNYYVVENFLKAYPVCDKEIRTGIVDHPLDGGVDAFFFFANRKYVFDDPLDPQAEYRVNLAIFQCKEGAGFSPVETGKFVFFAEDLLDLGRDEKDYKSNYHDRLRTLMAIFKEQLKEIIASISSFEVDFFYVSKLDIDDPKPDSDVANYAERVKKKVLIPTL